MKLSSLRSTWREQFGQIITGALAHHCHKTNPRIANGKYEKMLAASPQEAAADAGLNQPRAPAHPIPRLPPGRVADQGRQGSKYQIWLLFITINGQLGKSLFTYYL
ncbi:hypothetical protein [Polaromonas sp. YR568]|uniref:hypothetical protein n=1 Tax=Polaromonas sp. YR568 TaxID=1855301 RepID=UPI00398BED15